MLVGTVIGVLVIPGLYYLFGKIADGRKLLKDETDEPLSELFEHGANGANRHEHGTDEAEHGTHGPEH